MSVVPPSLLTFFPSGVAETFLKGVKALDLQLDEHDPEGAVAEFRRHLPQITELLEIAFEPFRSELEEQIPAVSETLSATERGEIQDLKHLGLYVERNAGGELLGPFRVTQMDYEKQATALSEGLEAWEQVGSFESEEALLLFREFMVPLVRMMRGDGRDETQVDGAGPGP